MTPADLRIVELTAHQCHDLRRRVLREGTPSNEVRFVEDAWPDTFHLGMQAGAPEGQLVAVATLLPRPTPWRERARAVQLRGMAVDPTWQGRGVGRRLLEHAMDRLRAQGYTVLWANARDTAIPFYERLGLEVVGEGFLTEDTRLPHHVVVGDL